MLESVVAFVLFLACCQGAPPDQDSRTALRKEDPVSLTKTEGGYEAELQLRHTRGLLSLRVTPRTNPPGAPLSMSRRVDLWRPLLEQALREYGRRPDYLLTVGEYPELSARLAVASACSGRWDFKTGRPVSGQAGPEVKELLANDQLYLELSQLASTFGYRVSVDSADSVMVCSWSSVRVDGTNGCRVTLDPDARVPCGASVVFRMSADAPAR